MSLNRTCGWRIKIYDAHGSSPANGSMRFPKRRSNRIDSRFAVEILGPEDLMPSRDSEFGLVQTFPNFVVLVPPLG